MADPRRISTRRAVLSYSQLKEMNPKWPDLMTKDYQGILQDFAFTADEIDGVEVIVFENQADIVTLFERVTDLESRIFRTIKTTESVTALSFQVVLCDNVSPISVQLNPDAKADDMIHVTRRNGLVTVNGLINGDNTGRDFNINRWSECYIFDGIEWVII